MARPTDCERGARVALEAAHDQLSELFPDIDPQEHYALWDAIRLSAIECLDEERALKESRA